MDFLVRLEFLREFCLQIVISFTQISALPILNLDQSQNLGAFEFSRLIHQALTQA